MPPERGEELTPWLIDYAYRLGAFPMTMEDGSVSWFLPRVRAEFSIEEGPHVSKSMRRVLASGRFRVTFDHAFAEVMRGCLRPEDNWISEDFIRVYSQIHAEGWGHSCEVWRGDDLVGGLYGIALGSCFCAESMFHRETNASKVALISMIERCRELGFTLFDAQLMNPHLRSMGARSLMPDRYMERLTDALTRMTPWSR